MFEFEWTGDAGTSDLRLTMVTLTLPKAEHIKPRKITVS